MKFAALFCAVAIVLGHWSVNAMVEMESERSTISALTKIYNRYISLPLQQKRENRDHKAPDYVQQTSLSYAKAMCRPYNVGDWFRFHYLKAFGFLTVYDGPEKKRSNFFTHNKNLAYASCDGGIYFPKGSFSSRLSPEQEATLAHENGHNMNGNTLQFTSNYKEGNCTWFMWEYRAQQKLLEALYKHKKYDAIIAESKTSTRIKWRLLRNPYCFGFLDTLESLKQQNPHDTQLCLLHKKTGASSNITSKQTLESRYKEYRHTVAMRKKIDCVCIPIFGATCGEAVALVLLKTFG